ncbi:hypothetical protein M0E87_04475 [Corynebacterium sp. CCM 9185]|uniref:Bacterial sensory transduction regulator n=1 Tax=Corynebacterium marambiense TaxID=2765364 RepID=A0ABS0VWY9_9CORY|nr:hypothetical protein [Corynebacterium marambiense]MBI9000814.1 hypothetical protein [Corynebacterium marambiense]MCK7662920.1 hypothetical protein [Corynebacterium marambiense]MCX7542529.1 hypothetical protein [Corynebacterium marambiense]
MASSPADHEPESTTGGIPDDPSSLFSVDYDTVFTGGTPPGRLNRGLRLTLLRLLGPAPFRAFRRQRERSGEPTKPLTFDMVREALDALRVSHSSFRDRITIAWPSVRGELLVVRDNGGLHLVLQGRLRGRTGVEQLPVLQDSLALGGERSLPVCFYPSVAADGTLSVRFHTSLCVESGITDAQLRTFLERGLVLVITGCLALIHEIPQLAGPRVDPPELLRADAVEATQPVAGAVIPSPDADSALPAVPTPLDMYRLRLILERIRGDAEPHPKFRALALTVDEVEVQVTIGTDGTGAAGDLIVISRWEVPVEGAATAVFGEAALACAAFDRRCSTVNARAALVEADAGNGPERVVVCAVAMFPVTVGATDAQLVAALECGITGVVEAITVIREVLP